MPRPVNSPELSGVNPDIVAWCLQAEVELATQGVGGNDWWQISRDEQFDRLDRIVGNTPIEQVPELPGVFSKLEYTNPSGSHYDRVTLNTLRLFERRGYIHPDDELRDITTGSGGISLALFGKLLGYKTRICLPEELPPSRIYPMLHFGAEVVCTGSGYIQTASDFQASEIRRFKEDPEWELRRAEDRDIRAFFFENRSSGDRISYINNSENGASPAAHQVLAREMVRQMIQPPANLLIAEGNWTTIGGIAPIVRMAWPETQIVSVAPADSDVINNFGLVVPGLTLPLRFRDPTLIDRQISVTDSEREAMRERVNDERPVGQKLGNSSLLLYAAAERLQSSLGGAELTIAYDQAMRY